MEVSIDTSSLKIDDLNDMFSYGIISYKDLEEELEKRKLFLDTHGEIIPIDGLYEDIKKALFLFYNGDIDAEGFNELFGDYPAEVFSRTHDLVVTDLVKERDAFVPIKKKRWEILDFS